MEKLIVTLLILSGALTTQGKTQEKAAVAVQCLSAGEGGNVGGVPGPKGWVLTPPCCKGLVDIESLSVCGKGHGGGYVYVCVKCGDNRCDKEYESACNCPRDCLLTTPKRMNR